MTGTLSCPTCRAEIPVPPGSIGPRSMRCPGCRATLDVETYPAMWQSAETGRIGERVTGEEAGCFVHADRRAEAACDLCGRFMCALCEVRVGEKSICVNCLESGRREGTLVQVERSRTLFSLIAIRVALFGLLLGPFAPAAGLSAMVLAVLGLARGAGITGQRYAGSAIAALVLGFGLTGVWTVWWIQLFRGSGSPFYFGL